MDSQDGIFSEKSKRILEKMGHRQGEGLGANRQGITQPIETQVHLGRRGLGFELPGMEAEDIDWEQEKVSVSQAAEWFPSCQEPLLSAQELQDTIEIGSRKQTIEDETTFIDQSILKEMLLSKTAFDGVPSREFSNARNRANPFEDIKCGIFQNRAAMKMANIDSVCNFMFTDYEMSPENNHELLFFADICAGPGGFSEYILWKKKWQAMGFGLTLKNQSNDFQLSKFNAESPTGTFQCLYGEDDTGDILKTENIRSFQRTVLETTNGRGVHFVMADGGVSVSGQENIQEIITKQLVMCQFLAAISILRKGGHFLCKTFDNFLPFTAELIYLMYRSFDSICILKPHTSRPANSERYFIGKGFREFNPPVVEYLFRVNDMMNSLRDSAEDVEHIFSLSQIQRDAGFYSNFVDSVRRIATKQVYSLKKVAAYIKNRQLLGEDQAQIRNECLLTWGIPIQSMPKPPHAPGCTIESFYAPLGGDSELRQINWSGLRSEHITGQRALFRITDDWVCVPTTARAQERCFVMGIHSEYSMAFCLADLNREEPKWFQIRPVDLQGGVEFPKATLVEGEFVQEYCKTTKRFVPSLHLFDAIVLGGLDVRRKSYPDRVEMLRSFVHAHHPVFTRPNHMPVRVKPYCQLHSLESMIEEMGPSHELEPSGSTSSWEVGGFYIFPYKHVDANRHVHALSYRKCVESRVAAVWNAPSGTNSYSIASIVDFLAAQRARAETAT